MTPIDRLRAKLTSIADSIRGRTGDTDKLSLDQMVDEIDYMPTGEDDNTYILVDEEGNEIPAVLTEEEVDLTATANDIRDGVIAVTDDGVIEGTKEIPTYHTTEGAIGILAGREIVVKIRKGRYDYTKLQALICAFNTSLSDSVSTNTVVINGSVYAVNSTEPLSVVVIDHDNESINLGIINESDNPCVFRYFTYKEEY